MCVLTHASTAVYAVSEGNNHVLLMNCTYPVPTPKLFGQMTEGTVEEKELWEVRAAHALAVVTGQLRRWCATAVALWLYVDICICLYPPYMQHVCPCHGGATHY